MADGGFPRTRDMGQPVATVSWRGAGEPPFRRVAPAPSNLNPSSPEMKRPLSAALLAATFAALVASPVLAQDKKKNDWTLSFPETKARFVKVNMEWAKKDPYWKPTKEELEARFDELDTDKDGKLSQEEWDNKDGAKPKKKKKS